MREAGTTPEASPPKIDAATIRAVANLLTDVANEADVDVRTAVAKARGEHVRGRAGERIDQAIAKKVAQ